MKIFIDAAASVYFGVFADSDLDHPYDDYIRSDTTLGIGFAYNTDPFNEYGYGERPAAVGIRFIQGPVGFLDEKDSDGDRTAEASGVNRCRM